MFNMQTGWQDRGNSDETKYKLYFADTGLLVAMLNEEAQEDLNIFVFMGMYLCYTQHMNENP